MSVDLIQFDPVPGWPQWWILTVLSLAFFITLSLRNAVRLGLPKAILLTSLRTLGIALLLGLLLRPSWREELPEEKKDIVLLAGIDTSASMQQTDAKNAKRIDAATRLVSESGLDDPRLRLRLSTFDDEVRSTTLEKLTSLRAEGTDTRIHQAVSTMLQSVRKDENASAMLLITDGHDFEMTSAAKTALAARARGVAIYTVPLGAAGQVRDVSLRISNYQPFCYVKQKCRITALARFTGCENEYLTVQLLRDGKLVDSKELSTRQEAEQPVEFIVSEAKAGQIEYEVRALPLYRETESSNNSAITYLNVLDDKLRVLLLEGEPNWDTTFLQRSLMRNDKIDLDAVIQFAPGKLRRIRKTAGQDDLKLPAAREEFEAYDLILLGAKMGDLLGKEQQAALVDAVRAGGGVVVCLRGQTGLDTTASAILEPAVWEEVPPVSGDLQVQREGRSFAPFQLILNFRTGMHVLPPLTSNLRIKERLPLAASLAVTRNFSEQITSDVFIHRPVGRGQSLALGARDLWHWAFQSADAARDALFDRFWDQIIIWLLASSEHVSGAQHRLRTSTANLPLGQEIFLRLQLKKDSQPATPPVIEISTQDDAPVPINMTATDNPLQFEARYVPPKTGRFRAQVTLPDASVQSARFMVFQENREATEVAADRTYLRKLAESSGGRMLEAAEVKTFISNLKDALLPGEPRFRLVSLWDREWVLYLILFLLALDWYLRRSWGLT
jgi:von Willebrand factor type A domain